MHRGPALAKVALGRNVEGVAEAAALPRRGLPYCPRELVLCIGVEATIMLPPDFEAGGEVRGRYNKLRSRIALNAGQRTPNADVDTSLCPQVARLGTHQ